MRLSALFGLLLLLLFAQPVRSQGPQLAGLGQKKGSLFLYWGYNRSRFGRSDIHFRGPGYDFTLYNLASKDRPSPFGSVYFNPTTFTIPQYDYRIGYFLTDRWAISGGLDHLKYVVVQDQMTHISGVIDPLASVKYAGNYLDQAIVLEKDLLQFEHSDGMNLVSVEAEYLQPLVAAWRGKLAFYWNAGAGGFMVVTKTNAKVLEDGLDNDFHLAGYSFNVKTGPRIEFLDRFFLLSELKGGYATLPSVLIHNEEPKLANHNVSYLAWYVAAGVNVRLKRGPRARVAQP